VARLEHCLLGLSEVVDRVAIELQHAELRERSELLGDDLGGIEQVETECFCLVLVDDLNRKLP
jgi:hypothetical protein